MTPDEKKQISDLNDRLPDVWKIRLMDNGAEGSAELTAFCQELTRHAPNGELRREFVRPSGHNHCNAVQSQATASIQSTPGPFPPLRGSPSSQWNSLPNLPRLR